MVGNRGSKLLCAAVVVLGALELPSCGADKTAPGAGAGSSGVAGSDANHAGAPSADAGSGGRNEGGHNSAGADNTAGQAGDEGGEGGAKPISSGGDGTGGAAAGSPAGGGAGSLAAGSPGGGTAGSSGTSNSAGNAGTAGSGGAAIVQGPAPLGMVAFFATSVTQCPNGWTREAAADGRVLIGTANGGSRGALTGVALGNHEDRMHTHTFSALIPVGSLGLSALTSGNDAPAKGGTVLVTGVTAPASSNLPFTQALACKLTEDTGQGDGFPAQSVAHFDQPACPDGWTTYTSGDQRIILPAAGPSSTSFGAGTHHQHSFLVSVNLGSVGLATTAGALGSLASPDSHQVSGASDLENVDIGPPTLALLVCHKSAAPLASAVVPSGTLSFLEGDTCPSDWQRYTDVEGRFLVGSPANIGDQFGGAPLATGELRMHTHTAAGGVNVPPQSLGGALGNTGFYGGSGSRSIFLTLQPAGISPARVELRTCRKQ